MGWFITLFKVFVTHMLGTKSSNHILVAVPRSSRLAWLTMDDSRCGVSNCAEACVALRKQCYKYCHLDTRRPPTVFSLPPACMALLMLTVFPELLMGH
jgi:hypothetical protein